VGWSASELESASALLSESTSESSLGSELESGSGLASELALGSAVFQGLCFEVRPTLPPAPVRRREQGLLIRKRKATELVRNARSYDPLQNLPVFAVQSPFRTKMVIGEERRRRVLKFPKLFSNRSA
jgi:hypothetical protein